MCITIALGALCEHEEQYIELTNAALKGGRMPGALAKARAAALAAVGDESVVANAIGVMAMFNGITKLADMNGVRVDSPMAGNEVYTKVLEGLGVSLADDFKPLYSKSSSVNPAPQRGSLQPSPVVASKTSKL